MGLPKNYRKNLNITPHKQGEAARQEILDNIANPGTYLPKGILHEDMDRDFIEYVKNNINLTLGGEEVPIVFLSIQRWAEFAKTWQFSDVNKNIKIPFITIVRKPDAQVGTNYAGAYNIPGKPTFTYMKIPTWDGNIKSFDIYQIPQPVSIDLLYEVRIFCSRMRDLNLFNKKMLKSFSAGQQYLRINGHPIPLMLESIGDESVISNLDERKYYVQLFTIKMLGYLLDPEDFKVTPAISRALSFFEVVEDDDDFVTHTIEAQEDTGAITLSVQFEPGVNVFNYTVENNATYNTVTIENISSYSLTLNGLPVSIPPGFEVGHGDVLGISITKSDLGASAYITLSGIMP